MDKKISRALQEYGTSVHHTDGYTNAIYTPVKSTNSMARESFLRIKTKLLVDQVVYICIGDG
jgi:hypothetical protein